MGARVSRARLSAPSVTAVMVPLAPGKRAVERAALMPADRAWASVLASTPPLRGAVGQGCRGGGVQGGGVKLGAQQQSKPSKRGGSGSAAGGSGDMRLP